MAKNPYFDRYEGIKSLPGDPLNPLQRRPFRVDEDGNVIHLDSKPGAGDLPDHGRSGDLARVGILNWHELDPRLDGRSAPPIGDIVTTGAQRPLAEGAKKSVTITRKTIGGVDYDVISSNTYDPALSNGVTAMPNAGAIAAMNRDKRQIAVAGSGPERGTRIIRLPFHLGAKKGDGPANERNLPLADLRDEIYYSLPIIDAKPGSTATASTLNLGSPGEFPTGTVALGHAHPDTISDGMVDDWDPSHKPHPIIGDVGSLRGNDPMPMATVSEDRVGWHQLENGRLQFMYPAGTKLRPNEAKKIQERLDLQQSLFIGNNP